MKEKRRKMQEKRRKTQKNAKNGLGGIKSALGGNLFWGSQCHYNPGEKQTWEVNSVIIILEYPGGYTRSLSL